MIHSQVAGGIVRNNNKFLIVAQRNNTWSLPKGHVDKGESFLDAAKREIYEESGVSDLKLIKGLGFYDRYRISLSGGDDKSELKTINMFLFESKQNDLEPIDSDNPEARWVSKEEVIELLTHKKDRAFFENWINKQ